MLNEKIHDISSVVSKRERKNQILASNKDFMFFFVCDIFISISKKYRAGGLAKRKIKLVWPSQYLKLTSHGILHYLRSADLSKSFYQLIMSIFIFSQYFFQQIVSCRKVWENPTLIMSRFINFEMSKMLRCIFCFAKTIT